MCSSLRLMWDCHWINQFLFCFLFFLLAFVHKRWTPNAERCFKSICARTNSVHVSKSKIRLDVGSYRIHVWSLEKWMGNVSHFYDARRSLSAISIRDTVSGYWNDLNNFKNRRKRRRKEMLTLSTWWLGWYYSIARLFRWPRVWVF